MLTNPGFRLLPKVSTPSIHGNSFQGITGGCPALPKKFRLQFPPDCLRCLHPTGPGEFGGRKGRRPLRRPRAPPKVRAEGGPTGGFGCLFVEMREDGLLHESGDFMLILLVGIKTPRVESTFARWSIQSSIRCTKPTFP